MILPAASRDAPGRRAWETVTAEPVLGPAPGPGVLLGPGAVPACVLASRVRVCRALEPRTRVGDTGTTGPGRPGAGIASLRQPGPGDSDWSLLRDHGTRVTSGVRVTVFSDSAARPEPECQSDGARAGRCRGITGIFSKFAIAIPRATAPAS
jgi:hypothetical protein